MEEEGRVEEIVGIKEEARIRSEAEAGRRREKK